MTEFVLNMTGLVLTMTAGRSRPAPSWPARNWPLGGGSGGRESSWPPIVLVI